MAHDGRSSWIARDTSFELKSGVFEFSTFTMLIKNAQKLSLHQPEFFVVHPVLVFFYTCVIAAFVETAAPRSTDNFFLQTVSLVVLMASVNHQQ